jgi:hypothetical protein
MQMLAVLAYAHENDVEPFLEPALRLCASLLNDVGACDTTCFLACLPAQQCACCFALMRRFRECLPPS